MSVVGAFPEDEEGSDGGREIESIQGRGNSKCKGPVEEAWLMRAMELGMRPEVAWAGPQDLQFVDRWAGLQDTSPQKSIEPMATLQQKVLFI